MVAIPDRARVHGVVGETLVSVALVFQLVGAVSLFVVAAVLGAIGTAGTGTGSVPVTGGGAFVVIGLILGLVTAVLLIVAYVWAYSPARRGDYAAAAGPTLALGIIFTVMIVTAVIGVLYLFAYFRLSESRGVSYLAQPSMVAGPPGAPAPWAWCSHCGSPIAWPVPLCPRCHAPTGLPPPVVPPTGRT